MEEVGLLAFLDEPLYNYRYTGQGISQGANGPAALEMWKLAVADAKQRRKITVTQT